MKQVLMDFYISERTIELPLELGDNVTYFDIYNFAGSLPLYITILPLKKHLNINTIIFLRSNLETENSLFSNFPNLERIEFSVVDSVETLDNFLTGFTSLSSIRWSSGSLVNISENAFEGLTSLSYIDLRYNSISYLPSIAFQNLPSLRIIDVQGNPLNCSTCGLQWMSIVDSKFNIQIDGECADSNNARVDSVSSHSHCHSTESYQCFNKSIECENTCINTPLSYICTCDEGYGLSLNETEQACYDIDECLHDITLCQGMKCNNILGSYECYCEEGFNVSVNSCSDINECSSNPCEHLCTNTLGSFYCACNTGFSLRTDRRTCQCVTDFSLSPNGSECIDIDECSDGNGGCEYQCVNNEGSYDCVCAEGFGLTVRGNKRSCVDIDECVENITLCQGMKCRNTLGFYQCYCEEGFYVTDNSCSDIDECSDGNGECEYQCVNNEGSYDCVCAEGFGLTVRGNNISCVDIDECLHDVTLCEGMKCRNTLGSYQCYCEEGFYVEANSCSDINECTFNPCEHLCTNTLGSFYCVCNTGFSLNTDGRTCQCVTGFSLSSNGNECIDIDECVENVTLCQGMKCRNTLGSYECYCEEGFYVEDNSCLDVDECSSNPCENACNNTVGSYECVSNDFQFTNADPTLPSLTIIFIVVSCFEAILLVFCCIIIIIVTCCNFKKYTQTQPSKEVLSPKAEEREYIEISKLKTCNEQGAHNQAVDEVIYSFVKEVSNQQKQHLYEIPTEPETTEKEELSLIENPNYGQFKH